VGDTFNVLPNLNVTFGVNYVRDSGRTDSDLAPIPCSAINTTIVATPPCSSGLLLDQFGLLPNVSVTAHQNLGERVNQPDWNFAPQLGVAWDPGHGGRTVIRASGGLFYDNFLLQNTYQDRINRLSNGQYNRSLTLCPSGSVLFPNGSVVSSVDNLDIATQICGAPVGSVATAIQDLQSQFLAAQSAVTGGPNVYSLANSLANFGGLLAPGFRTPRIVHLSGGIEHQLGEHGVFSADYVRELGTQFPLGIDTNHVGDAGYMTDGSNSNPAFNKRNYRRSMPPWHRTRRRRDARRRPTRATRASPAVRSHRLPVIWRPSRPPASPTSRATAWIHPMRSAARSPVLCWGSRKLRLAASTPRWARTSCTSRAVVRSIKDCISRSGRA
jgi:hypothetical protein